jgi:hypothetical protein
MWCILRFGPTRLKFKVKSKTVFFGRYNVFKISHRTSYLGKKSLSICVIIHDLNIPNVQEMRANGSKHKFCVEMACSKNKGGYGCCS